MDLKFPAWAGDVRYYGDESPAGDMDPDRGVRFTGLAGGGWPAPASFPGQWFRDHCRPAAGGGAAIEGLRGDGRPVGAYLSGGMVPVTYALLPVEEEDWTNDFMRRYAGTYWHQGERWWGASGDYPGFAAWMLPHLDFAREVGFGSIHVGEAWGAYPDTRELHKCEPGYLVVTNNLAMSYVGVLSSRFGWTAMGEAAGTPHEWDHFLTNLRGRALVRVGGLLVLDAALRLRLDACLSRQGGARVDAGLETVVVPGEQVDVTVSREDLVSGDPARDTQLHAPPGWEVQVLGTGPEHTSRFAVSPPSDAPVDHGWPLTPTLSGPGGSIPSQTLLVTTRAPLTFRLRPPFVESPSRGPGHLELEITSHTRRGEAVVTMETPEGWRTEPSAVRCALGPGEAHRVSVALTVPDQRVGFWHHDVRLALDWHLGERSGRFQARLRVFPAMCSVYQRGIKTRILHGYSNVLLSGDDFEAAKRELLAGGYVALWLANCDLVETRPLVEWFLDHGGGVVWMGRPFDGEQCPAVSVFDEPGLARGLVLGTGDVPALRLAVSVARFRSYYESDNGFTAWQAAPKDWAQVAATWNGAQTTSGPLLPGGPRSSSQTTRCGGWRSSLLTWRRATKTRTISRSLSTVSATGT